VADERIFRLDRIRSVSVLEAPADVPKDVDLSKYESLYLQGAQDRPVTLDLAPQAAAWVAESYPLESQQVLADGWVRVHLTAGGTAWLEKLLLRLGPQARVVEPPDLAERTRELACRLAQRYR
jgi:predicted DNA-binding transcriptional regulator YafY